MRPRGARPRNLRAATALPARTGAGGAGAAQHGDGGGSGRDAGGCATSGCRAGHVARGPPHSRCARLRRRHPARCPRCARRAGVLVTLGVRPTRPETGYGYIQVGAPLGQAHPKLHRVRRFVEKPDASRARRYLRHGGYLWNAGIFVWTARAILKEIERWMPGAAPRARPVRAEAGRRLRAAALARAYRRAPSLPIDIARHGAQPTRLDPARALGTGATSAPGSRWPAELGVKAKRSRTWWPAISSFDDRGGNLVWGCEGRPVALLGVEGLAVVDTGDALLVARLDRSDEVRRYRPGTQGSGPLGRHVGRLQATWLPRPREAGETTCPVRTAAGKRSNRSAVSVCSRR